MSNDPTGRALQLLSLLQTHRLWRASALAERLGITARTVRRDVDRLRVLGYEVEATPGTHGGYRLRAGAHLPPLMLDDDEAVAVAIGLRHAAVAAVEGVEETSLRALTKLQLLLPPRLRRRVSALYAGVTTLRPSDGDLEDRVDPEVLTLLAAACRDNEHVRFEYRGGRGDSAGRWVQPHRLVTAGRRWYLVAWDEHRSDWRTFRLDRIGEIRGVGSRFAPRGEPDGDAARFVARSVQPPRVLEADLILGAPLTGLDDVLRFFDHTPVTSTSQDCRIRVRAEDVGRLAMAVARFGLECPVTVVSPVDLVDTVARLAGHLSPSQPDELG